MILVDTALARRHEQANPIRVAVVGAGFAGRGLALQLLTATPGMRLVAVVNRTLSEAERAYREAGVDDVVIVNSVAQLEAACDRGCYAITDDPRVVTEAGVVDAIIEITGEVEYGAQVVLAAIEQGKHVILMNAELDATLGPILKCYADQANVVFSDADGDQPGVLMNLCRQVRALGLRPVMAGNIKSLLDHRRTPETQKAWAAQHFQRPKHVTSFADGTKIAMEMATVANATGFRVGRRGMYGPRCSHVDEAVGLFALDELLCGPGLVDYILGAQPSFGVFVLAHTDQPLRQRYLKIYKMGDGPLYTFYTPYHLSPLEAPMSVARAVLFGDAALAPQGAPVCEVITVAKRNLKAGEVLDGIGGFTCYGTIDNADLCRVENLLPMGLSEGCRLKRDLPMDAVLSFDDVELPMGRLADRLWQEQLARFTPTRPLQIVS
ncbi:MAG: Gfo/Idh/MocA family oxidoreductase [Gloeobacterales cyanobacterium]